MRKPSKKLLRAAGALRQEVKRQLVSARPATESYPPADQVIPDGVEATLNIVVHNYGGSTEEVNVFLTPQATLQFLSDQCGEEFKTAKQFAKWQEKNAGTDKSMYTWHVHKLSLVVE